MLERRGQREEFAEAIPAEEVILGELLDVLRGGAAGARLEEAAAVHQWDDGQHLGARADLEDREQVGEIIAEHVTRDRDRVLAGAQTLQRVAAGVGGREDAQIETGGVVLLQVRVDLGDHLRVVGARGVEPEHGRRLRETGAVHGQLHPVLDWGVLRLAGAPDIAGLDGVGKQHLGLGPGGVGLVGGQRDDAKGAVARGGERLVVGAVFLGGLGHETHVRNRAHRARIEGAVLAAEIDDRLVDARVAAVGDEGERVLELAGGVPHLAGGTDHRRHGRVDDHVARYVQIRDALVGVDHREGGALRLGGLEVGLDRGARLGREGLDLGDEIAEAIVQVDVERREGGGVLGEDILEIRADGMAEEDGVGDLHHRRLEVERQQQPLAAGAVDLRLVEGEQGAAAHDGGVEDFAGLEGRLVLEHDRRAVSGRDELDPHGDGLGDGDGLLVAEEIIAGHRSDVGARRLRPRAHRVRVLACVVLYGLGRAAVGVALAEDRVDGGAHDLAVARAGILLGGRGRRVGERGQCVAEGLQFGDGGLHLRHGGADIGQLDDIGLGLERQGAELGECVGRALGGREHVSKGRDDAAGEGDVARFDGDAGALGERLDDGKQRIRGEGRRFVGLRVDDGRSRGHRVKRSLEVASTPGPRHDENGAFGRPQSQVLRPISRDKAAVAERRSPWVSGLPLERKAEEVRGHRAFCSGRGVARPGGMATAGRSGSRPGFKRIGALRPKAIRPGEALLRLRRKGERRGGGDRRRSRSRFPGAAGPACRSARYGRVRSPTSETRAAALPGGRSRCRRGRGRFAVG